MIRITVKYATHNEELPANDNATVGDILEQYGDMFSIPDDAAATVNGNSADDEYILRTGDVVKFATTEAGTKG